MLKRGVLRFARAAGGASFYERVPALNCWWGRVFGIRWLERLGGQGFQGGGAPVQNIS